MRIAVSVSNDLLFDQRVAKTCASFHKAGHEVILIGRKTKGNAKIERPYSVKLLSIAFRGGFFFYAFLNLRLFWKLCFAKVDLLWANDLDTLPANALVAAIRRKPLIYDSHEFFTEVPEVQGRKFVQAFWKFAERKSLRSVSQTITVNASIAEALERKYAISKVLVVRNVGDLSTIYEPKNRIDFGLPITDFLVVLEGRGINVDRGAEELIDGVASLSGVSLLFVGGGDVWESLKISVENRGMRGIVHFIPAVAYAELLGILALADVGMSLDKPNNKNYEWSLPNKIFDYSLAGLPIIASDLVEVKNIVNGYQIGRVIDEVSPALIAAAINDLRNNPTKLARFAANTARLNAELNWENEFKPVLDRIIELQNA